MAGVKEVRVPQHGLHVRHISLLVEDAGIRGRHREARGDVDAPPDRVHRAVGVRGHLHERARDARTDAEAGGTGGADPVRQEVVDVAVQCIGDEHDGAREAAEHDEVGKREGGDGGAKGAMERLHGCLHVGAVHGLETSDGEEGGARGEGRCGQRAARRIGGRVRGQRRAGGGLGRGGEPRQGALEEG